MKPGDHIAVGQVYASTHSGDVRSGDRQRRRVTAIDLSGPFVWLSSEEAWRLCPPSRVRLRSAQSRTIPGHRLVEDVEASA